MDLGATICTVRAPRCLLCPLRQACQAHSEGQEEVFPVKPPRKAKPARHGHAFWIERNGNVLLVQRPGSGMLGGMRALPDDGWSARGDGSGAPAGGQLLGAVEHVFTHFSLRLKVLRWQAGKWPDSALPTGEWWPLARMDDAGLPTLFAKAARLALAQREMGER